MKSISLIIIAIGILFSPLSCLGEAPKNFGQAKKVAAFIWKDHRETFYCGCKYDKHGRVNLASCNYKNRYSRPLQRISWEHVVPVSRLAQQFPCWKENSCSNAKGEKYKGRKCCRKIDPHFRQLEAELYNLVPALYEVNLKRKNYHFAEFPLGASRPKFHFNQCSIIIDERYGLVEPRDEVKGMVARIYLYLSQKYGFLLSDYEQRLFAYWNEKYPPSEWEKEWGKKVALIQGDHNEFVS